MKVALTLGKFAPLHRGHQLLLETALAECDHVIVMIYPARETDVPLARRASWIRRLYPRVEIFEAWDGPTEVGYTPAITRAHDDYITTQMRGRGVTHFFSSEPYGHHVSAALGAIDRRVDVDRRIVPVSGTAVRADPYRWRKFLDPIVYQDLITRVALVGAPSTGKTTLATALAAHFHTTWMPEYGREYWEKNHVNRRLPLEALVEIAETHRQREDALASEANRFLFVDTEAVTTRLFSLYYHGRCDERLSRLADESRDRYDLFVLCDDDIPFADTPDRSGPPSRDLFQGWIRNDLAARGIAPILVSGSVQRRVASLAAFLAGYDKYAGRSDVNGICLTDGSPSGASVMR